MSRLTFEGVTYTRDAGESVLDCLRRHGVAVSHGCKAGICQSCLMRSEDSPPPVAAQKGLPENLRESGHFLACMCHPEGDFAATTEGPASIRLPARVVAIDKLSPTIARLRLEHDAPFGYRPGQFLNLYREDGLVRSYSIASIPQQERFVELHVRRIDHGRMSGWIHDELKPGQRVDTGRPSGDCFYRDATPDQPLLLIGTGCGLAPLYGVVRDALRRGHEAPVWLYHGSSERDGLYLMDELRALEREYLNFHYVPCLSRGEIAQGVASGRADEAALDRHRNLRDWRVYLCGHPEMVAKTRKMAFLSGAALAAIHADPFVLTH